MSDDGADPSLAAHKTATGEWEFKAELLVVPWLIPLTRKQPNLLPQGNVD